MRIAIFADTHGNLPALQAFMKDSFNKGVQCYQFLGDAVNYGGKPQECIDEIIKLGLISHVRGIDINTDPAVSTGVLSTNSTMVNYRENSFWEIMMRPAAGWKIPIILPVAPGTQP